MQHSIRTLHKIFILNDLQLMLLVTLIWSKQTLFLIQLGIFITIHFYVQHF